MKRWIALLTFSLCVPLGARDRHGAGLVRTGDQTVAVQGYISSANTPAQRSYQGVP